MENLIYTTLGNSFDHPNPLPNGHNPDLDLPDLRSPLTLLGVSTGLLVSSFGGPLPQAQALLQRGDSCQAVADLQDALIQAGFDPGAADGSFGGQTEYAVMRFQEANNLTNDRVVGASTADALGLDPAIACEVANTPTETPGETEDGAVAVITIPVRFGRIVTEGDILNVRSGPGVDYDVVNTLPQDTLVRIVGQPVDSWLQLVEGGWVSGEWVTLLTSTPADATTSDTTAKTGGTIVRIPSQSTVKARLESDPTSSTTQASQPQTTTIASPASTTPSSQAPRIVATRTTDEANTPSTTPARAGEATADTPDASPTASEPSGSGSGADEATADTPDASPTASEPSGSSSGADETSSSAPTVQTVKISTGGAPLNVRKSPNSESEVLRIIDNDTEVTTKVVAANGDPNWLELTDGGWIASSWVTVQQPAKSTGTQPQG